MTYSTINSLFSSQDGALNAAEAHGIAVGMLCVDLQTSASNWMSEIVRDNDAIDSDDRELLASLFESTRGSLQDDDYAFDLLLPDAEEPLPYQAAAMRDWCQGFLFGIGYSRSKGEWPGECGEILQDIVEISRLDSAAGGEEEENAFTQIHEYLRAAVLIIAQEFNSQSVNQTQH